MLILLKQCYVNQVLAGTKTSTIRPWPRCYLRPGSAISFNGRVRATCTAVERLHLSEVGEDDARADGFADRADFERAFLAIYPHATSATPVWVIRFRLNDSDQSARASDTSGQLFPTC